MVHKVLLRIIKKYRGRSVSELKALALSMGLDGQTFDDTLKYYRQEPLYFTKIHRSNIGKGKLAAMIAISWCTWLVGLGNLIFLKGPLRRNAIIALSVTVAVGMPLLYVSFTAFFMVMGLAVWMTIDAINSYRMSKWRRRRLADKFGGFIE